MPRALRTNRLAGADLEIALAAAGTGHGDALDPAVADTRLELLAAYCPDAAPPVLDGHRRLDRTTAIEVAGAIYGI
jgi:hypothetical protein